MARFQHRTNGEVVGATRLRSPKEMETADRGWVTGGVNTWEIHSIIPGRRSLNLTDQAFRAQYEPIDPSADAALAIPGIGEQKLTHEAPAPPDHSKTQALQPVRTAADYAAERQAGIKAKQAVMAADAAAAADAGNDNDIMGASADELVDDEGDLALPEPPKAKRKSKNKK